MMTSTDICNLALSYLGKGRINSIEDDSEEGRQCKIHYDHDRRRLLLSYPWGFATRTQKIAQRTVTVPGWKYTYGYPAGALHVMLVFDEDHADCRQEERQDFDILMMGANDRVIGTNVKEAWAEYIYDVKDPQLFSEEFNDAFAHTLAASLAIAITGSANLLQQNLQMAQAAVSQARYLDTIQQERRTRYPHKYADARFR